VQPISKEAWDQIQKTVNSYPKEWKHGVCAFQIINRESGKIENRRNSPIGDVCHAGLVYTVVNDWTAPIVVNAHKDTWQRKNREFLLWVAQEAPFNHGVLNRTNEDELLNHAAVLDLGLIGKGGALWHCKAMRHFTEDEYKLKTWTSLREKGLDGLQAFIGADILNVEGFPYTSCTHVGLFGYCDPTDLRKFYDEIRNEKRIDGSNAAKSKYYDQNKKPNWGSLTCKLEKKPDGWGGFIEIRRPCDATEYAAKLKEIFEGDPKNVK